MRVGESNPLWKSPVNSVAQMQMRLFHAYLYFYIFINHLYWMEHIATYGLHGRVFLRFVGRGRGSGEPRRRGTGSPRKEDGLENLRIFFRLSVRERAGMG